MRITGFFRALLALLVTVAGSSSVYAQGVVGQGTWESTLLGLLTGSGATAVSDWRLPTLAANPNPNYSFDGSTALGDNVPANSSEMASLFFSTLGNKSYLSTSGVAQTGWGPR